MSIMSKLTYILLTLLIENRQSIFEFIMNKVSKKGNTKRTVSDLEKLRDSYPEGSVERLEIQNVIDKLKEVK